MSWNQKIPTKRQTFKFRPEEHMHTATTHTHTAMREGATLVDRVVWNRMSGRVGVPGCVDCGLLISAAVQPLLEDPPV